MELIGPWVWKIPWRRAWKPTPVFLPGEFHGQRSLQLTIHRVKKNQTRLKRLNMHTYIEQHVLKKLGSLIEGNGRCEPYVHYWFLLGDRFPYRV